MLKQRKTQDLAGRRFGRLVITALGERKKTKWGTRVLWQCQCDCGGTTLATLNTLASGHSKSCGCLQKEVATDRATKHGGAPRGRRSPEYMTWAHVKRRCLDENASDYPHYGGRGIGICAQWLEDFAQFLRDVGARPSASHSLDRIDNNGHYEPDNVRWATHVEQMNNTRRNRLVTAFGETKSVAAWGRQLGWRSGTLQARLDRGWDGEEAIERPLTQYEGRTGAEQNARRRAAQKQATPAWLTREQRAEMRMAYCQANKEGLHVDHIEPLLGRLVCGLHVPWNLRLIPPQESWSKNNRQIAGLTD